jgi:hypothetical protein
MEDYAEITPKNDLYQPAKGFAIMKSINSPLPTPTSYYKATNGSKSS